MKNITRNMTEITRIRQEIPPCGAVGPLGFPLNGLIFAIHCDGITALLRGMSESSGMIARAAFAALLFALTACRENSAPLRLLPDSMAGGWRRTSLRDVPVSEAPDPVPRTAVTRFETASYEGPGKLEARIYELGSPEVGANLAQRWRPSADTVFFTEGRFFAVVKWQQADRTALQSFVRDLEGRMKH